MGRGIVEGDGGGRAVHATAENEGGGRGVAVGVVVGGGGCSAVVHERGERALDAAEGECGVGGGCGLHARERGAGGRAVGVRPAAVRERAVRGLDEQHMALRREREVARELAARLAGGAAAGHEGVVAPGGELKRVVNLAHLGVAARALQLLRVLEREAPHLAVELVEVRGVSAAREAQEEDGTPHPRNTRKRKEMRMGGGWG